MPGNSEGVRTTGDRKSVNWVAEEQGDRHMTLIASARFRALFIISIVVVVVLLFLSSAVQATGRISDTDDYRVKPGDTLWGIAREFGPANVDIRQTVAVIKKLNGITGSEIMAGQVIEIPVPSS